MSHEAMDDTYPIRLDRPVVDTKVDTKSCAKCWYSDNGAAYCSQFNQSTAIARMRESACGPDGSGYIDEE